MIVLDSSALLAYLFGEQGSDFVEEYLPDSVIGAANWSEVICKIKGRATRSVADSLLMSLGVGIEPVTKADAAKAAEIHETRPSLPLGDRLCLALAHRLDLQVLTADRAWGAGPEIVQVRD